jgi:hypothetical protein
MVGLDSPLGHHSSRAGGVEAGRALKRPPLPMLRRGVGGAARCGVCGGSGRQRSCAAGSNGSGRHVWGVQAGRGQRGEAGQPSGACAAHSAARYLAAAAAWARQAGAPPSASSRCVGVREQVDARDAVQAALRAGQPCAQLGLALSKGWRRRGCRPQVGARRRRGGLLAARMLVAARLLLQACADAVPGLRLHAGRPAGALQQQGRSHGWVGVRRAEQGVWLGAHAGKYNGEQQGATSNRVLGQGAWDAGWRWLKDLS